MKPVTWIRVVSTAAAFLAGYAQAVPVVVVSVTEGDKHSYNSHYELTEARHSIDLRDSHPYHVALKDKARGRDVCREADYRTGLYLTFRDTGERTEDAYNIEVIGQVSSVNSVSPGETLSCGQNTIVELGTKAFSDTSLIQVGKPKVIVIDNKWTVLVTIKE